MGSSGSTCHVSVLGLDGAGKTTLLYRLKLGHYTHTAPTVSFNCEKVTAGDSSLEVWDVGGDEKLRPLWRAYTRRAGAVVFVVDSADPERLSEARTELMMLSKLQECAGLPFLILANKQDLPDALSVEEVTSELGLQELEPQHAWHASATCAVTGEGLEEAMTTLSLMVAKRKRRSSSSGSKRKKS